MWHLDLWLQKCWDSNVDHNLVTGRTSSLPSSENTISITMNFAGSICRRSCSADVQGKVNHVKLPCVSGQVPNLEEFRVGLSPSTCIFFRVCVCVCVCAQSCLTLCNLKDCSPPGSSVHGILQARTLEWVAISSSRGSSRPRD